MKTSRATKTGSLAYRFDVRNTDGKIVAAIFQVSPVTYTYNLTGTGYTEPKPLRYVLDHIASCLGSGIHRDSVSALWDLAKQSGLDYL